MKKQVQAFLLATLFTISGGMAYGYTLYSGIQHEDYLAPIATQPASALNQRLQAGASQPQYNLAIQRATPSPQFESPMAGHADAYHSVPRLVGSANVAQGVGTTVEWFMIPKWLAGAWRKQGDLTVSYRDLRTGRFTSMSAWTENEMTITWGHQYDRQGNIWHADILPLEKDGWTKGKLARFLMTELKCERTSERELVTRARYIVSETYNGSSSVADMFQQESLNDYTMLSDGELDNNSSNRIFSSAGQPLREGALVSKMQKVGAFAPQQYQNNIDLVQSLNTYLNTHGLQNLVPQPQTSLVPGAAKPAI
ncbi:MAG: hypothetical protein SGJ27_19355 [Candidatus Melainabacteria bacterium]|nr:hypothetical protein [Candidatus Melainabacteria bacterium]